MSEPFSHFPAKKGLPAVCALERLEDITPRWRRHVAPLVEEGVGQIIAALPDPLPDAFAVEDAASERARRHLRERAVPECLNWLRDEGHWQGSTNTAQHDIGGGSLSSLPRPSLPMPPERCEVAPWRWSLPAALGALLGVLAGPPLSLLATGERGAGLLVGPPLGAAALVLLLAWLADRPWLRTLLEVAATAASVFSAIGAVWALARGRKARGWLQAAALSALAALVSFLVRPRAAASSREEAILAWRGPLRALLAHDAELVLAWCWAHHDRCGTARPAAPASSVPEAVCDEMTKLHAALHRVAPDPEVRFLVETLIQRFEDEGHVWHWIEAGTPFTDELEARFRVFGVVQPGQAVEMLQPALLRGQVVLRPGLVRRHQQ